MKKDWNIKKLVDICDFFAGYTPKQNELSDLGDIPYFKVSDMNRDGNELFMSETELYAVSPKKIIPKDSIVFPKNGGAVFTNKKRILLQDSVIDLNSEGLFHKDYIIDVMFLYYFLQLIDLKDYSKGAALPTIDMTALKNVSINVPPLEEQKYIVKILDEKIAQLETIKANAQTNLQNAKDLFQAQLTKAFSNTTWEKKRLGDLCSKIGSGATPKGGKDSYKTEGIHLVRSMNVYDNKFVYDELACIDDKQAYELRNVELQEDDVLFNITGASVCRCCVLPSDVLPARVNQHVSILRPKQEQLNPTFLCSAMLGYKEILYKMACVGGSTRQAITKSQLEDFEIPLPPLLEQKRIVKELDTLSEKVRQLQEIYTKQIANCDELKQSYLQKAFEGEL